MTYHFSVIPVTFGLLLSFITYAMTWIKRSLCLPFAILSISFLSYCSLSLFILVLKRGPFEYYLGGWPPPIGIAYYIDELNAFLSLLVYLVALINLLCNWARFLEKQGDRIGGTMALYILFISGLNGILLTADLFNLYVLLEIASLTGYALLAIGDKRQAPFASLNYVFLGTIGACFYLLGVGYLYIKTGSLNMQDVSGLITKIPKSPTILSGFIFILIGIWIKMGLFPFHIWLPRAYTNTFGPVSSLIAPLGTKVMAYVIFRVILFVFGKEFSFEIHSLGHVATLFGVAAILYGAITALRQTDLRRMLCFVVITEIGYIVAGLGVGNINAIRGSLLHLLNDVAMTFCLFLSADHLTVNTGTKIEELKGVFQKTPFGSSIYVLASLSVIGIPPSPGFF
ncbi:MAG: complex I subunit 5 family protein, partial [Desulfatiglandales bacterium]